MMGIVAWQKLIGLITSRHQSLISLGSEWMVRDQHGAGSPEVKACKAESRLERFPPIRPVHGATVTSFAKCAGDLSHKNCKGHIQRSIYIIGLRVGIVTQHLHHQRRVV
jgi:hypothetical protein